ncbi:hypothetical protein [Streptomyces sp. NPDC001914]|uniref:hypothetical protein n=1 Tax=Streptomyces sp. NPDC001914 TaxID=3364623 RepID=UPI0036B14B8C
MSDLPVITHPKWAPACPSGRHIVHQFYECDEVDVLAAAVAGLYQQAMAETFAETQAVVDRLLITGNGTGEPRSILATPEPREPTPMDRALHILDLELRACPLYDAGPPVVRGPYWKA